MRTRSYNFVRPFRGVVPALCLLIAAMIGTGCETTTVRQDPFVSMSTTTLPPVAAAMPKPKPPSVGPQAQKEDPADPCKMRLQDMIGAIYLYYTLHQRLPDKLDELRSLADADVELNFTCPASSQAYVYNPGGLQASGGSNLPPLILYDATPAHNGHRHGVVAGPTRNKHNQPFFQAFVVDLSEATFRSYAPLPAPAAQPAGAGPADVQILGNVRPVNPAPDNSPPNNAPPPPPNAPPTDGQAPQQGADGAAGRP